MRIHTDLTAREISDAFRDAFTGKPSDGAVYLDTFTEHGSRKRPRAFEIRLDADAGADRYGFKRSHAPQHPSGPGMKAATWFEWGDLIAAIFERDPDAIVGQYDGVSDFLRQTKQEAPRRGWTADGSPWQEVFDRRAEGSAYQVTDDNWNVILFESAADAEAFGRAIGKDPNDYEPEWLPILPAGASVTHRIIKMAQEAGA